MNIVTLQVKKNCKKKKKKKKVDKKKFADSIWITNEMLIDIIIC